MRQHVAVPSRPVLTACLCACLPALRHPCCREACALFQRPLSRPRARAARSHLGSSWHTLSVPIRAMQTDCANRCIMFMSLSDCPETLHMPVALSPSAISLPRPFAHSLARQNAQRAALPATKAGRRTVVSASVPVYDDHISQLHGSRSDNTGETRATPTLCDCLLDGARSHALGGDEAAPVIGTKRISCRPPGPLDGLAALMLAAGVSSAGQIVERVIILPSRACRAFGCGGACPRRETAPALKRVVRK